jgi:hypothetical protein
MTTARAFWITGPSRGELKTETLVPPGPDAVAVQTHYSGISRGTETLVFAQRVPPSEYERMRAPFQDGEFPAPVKYGYSNVGKVVDGPADLENRYVFCLYPHQTHYVVPLAALTVIPDDVPAERAVLAANLETAINGVWDATPRAGDRVAVIGAGTVGSLAAWLAAGQLGTSVELIDIDPRKASIAERLGVEFRGPDDATSDADIVIDASGAAEGLALGLELAGFEARVIELSWFGSTSVPLGASFHSKRLQLISSQVATIAAPQRCRWDHARRMQLVMRLLANDRLDALISGESPFDDLPSVMTALATNAGMTLCHRIKYR